jgi:hypothetical protein
MMDFTSITKSLVALRVCECEEESHGWGCFVVGHSEPGEACVIVREPRMILCSKVVWVEFLPDTIIDTERGFLVGETEGLLLPLADLKV